MREKVTSDMREKVTSDMRENMTSDLTSYFKEKKIQVAIRISSAMRFKPHSSYLRVISEAFSHIRPLGIWTPGVYSFNRLGSLEVIFVSLEVFLWIPAPGASDPWSVFL